ncbi:MAG: glycine-rich protein, partial [Bacteroidota bacterium]
GNYKRPGYGGRVEATLSVSPGDTLNIYVGARGDGYNEPGGYGTRAGGWNGGGNSNSYKAGGGGGATDIRIGGQALTDRVLVAGGGGGSGGSSCGGYGNTTGGGGGNTTGANGGQCNAAGSNQGGRGGTPSGGGSGSCRNGYCGTAGSLGQGGNGSPSWGGDYGGGGGGGYYGGGGGAPNADGGGGSSYTDATLCSNVIHYQDAQNGNGQLIITYSQGSSCASSTRVPVTVNVNTVPSVTTSADTAICNGNQVTLNAYGADSYVWTPGNLTGSSITVSPNTSSTYTVVGTLNAGGCSSQSDVSVTISQVVASADVAICEGQSTTLSVSGSYTYSWEPGGLSGTSITVSPSSTTEYIVTGTEINGCTTEDTVLVTVNSIPSLSISSDTTIEYNSSASLNGSGADTYAWSPTGETTANISVSPLSETTYTLTGTYTATGCQSSEQVTVYVIDPLLIAGDRRICEGATATLQASGTSGATINWYDAATGGNLLATGSTYTSPILNTQTDYYAEQILGTYTSSRLLARVYVNTLPSPSTPVNAIANPPTICAGESASIRADVDQMNAQRVHWYDSLTGGNLIAITDSGEVYTVTPSDTTTYYAASAAEAISMTFSYTGAVQSFVVPDGVTSIEVDAYGARGGWGNYKRPGYGGRVQATLQVTPGETLNIYVGGRGEGYNEPGGYGTRAGGWNGGGNSNSYRVGGGGGATDIRIGGTALEQRVIVAGGGGGSGGSSCSGYGNTTGGGGGNTTGANGGQCNSGGSNLGGRGGSPSAGGSPGCRNGYCGSSGSQGQGGNGSPSYGGSYGGGGGAGYYGGGGGAPNADGGGGSSYTDPALCSNITHSQDAQNGNGQLIIRYTTAESCGSGTRVPVTVNVDPQATLNTTTSIQSCPGSIVELTATGADQYLWLPNNSVGDTIQVSPLISTTYTLVGSMNTGTCNDTATIELSIDMVSASISQDTICDGQTINIQASGATTYLWTPGNLSGSSHNLSPSSSTTYVVEGTGDSACQTYDSVQVVVVPNNLDMTTTADTTILSQTNALLMATGADSIVWSDGTINDSLKVFLSSAAEYTVTGYDAYGCSDTDTIAISIDDMPEVTGTTIILKGSSTTLYANPPSLLTTSSGHQMSFSGSGSSTTYTWYDAPAGGNVLSTTDSYTTPALDTNVVYFVEMDDGSGASLRKCITVNIVDVESTVARTEQDSICPSGSTNISGDLENPGVINWYDAPTGGNLLGSSNRGEAFAITPGSTTTYYAQGETEQQSVTFNYTGSLQTFTVPEGVTSISVDAYGAAGGNARYTTGGRGGRVQATLNVTPGESLNIYVGGQGTSFVSGQYSARAGGWNGGGTASTYYASAGGGASDIRIGGTTVNDRIIVAGGGGGGKGSSCGTSGPGGGGNTTGGSGGHCYSGNSASGGTQTSGGNRGCYGSSYCGGYGSFGNGGNGNYYSGTSGGGGGGGGWYGGGGGHIYGNGGGGSSYTHPDRCANVQHTQGTRSGHGQITLTYSLNNVAINMDSITVDVGDYENPVPDIANLPMEEDENSVTLTPPTATDDCAGSIMATTLDPLTYNSPGTFMVNWEYSDGNGNISTQQQAFQDD